MPDETETIDLPIGIIMKNCDSWDDFCSDLGINPWIINEGLACDSDTVSLTIKQARKHGIFS